MQEHAIYFGKSDIYNKIRAVGGIWNDTKERPIVCLIESVKQKGVFWAIPVGDLSHRQPIEIQRIQSFIKRPKQDLRSCYYHIGNTNKKSIFFISDVIPITIDYIDREYLGYGGNVYILKNKILLDELKRKLSRILSFEQNKPNYFRQHITDIYNELVKELKEKNETEEKEK